jgi:dihydrolipoamide dehydrogenase
MQTYDVVVIGAGPGGYVAAIKAAQLGLKVACIEKSKTLGGTCLNVGCIPSKALLDSSEKYHELMHSFADHGIKAQHVTFDLKQVMSRKDSVVSNLTAGIAGLFKKNKVTHIFGSAKIVKQGVVQVDNETLHAKNIVIATGSVPIDLPGIEVDEERIVSSTGALSLTEVPKHLVVIGGGYIGLELGSVWMRYGAQVEVIEAFDRIVPAMDHEVGQTLHKELEKQGMKFRVNTLVKSAKNTGKKVELTLSHGGTTETAQCDVLLVSVGRKPNTNGLGLEAIGVKLDDRGRVVVSEKYETNVKGIYAIGDIIQGPMLAHKAEEEGIAVAEILAGRYGHVNYDAIPSVIYTEPEVASVGKTEEELKREGKAYNVGKFPFAANGRARASGNTVGFVKILACKKTDQILGCHIIGHNASTLIAELVLALEYAGSSEDVARSCHAHPTLNEAVKEAAMGAFGKQLHY